MFHGVLGLIAGCLRYFRGLFLSSTFLTLAASFLWGFMGGHRLAGGGLPALVRLFQGGSVGMAAFLMYY